MNNILLANILAYIGVATSGTIRITKIIALAKYQDIERSNYSSSLMSIISGLIWLYYGIIIESLPLIFSAVINIIADFILIALTFYIIRKNRKIIIQ